VATTLKTQTVPMSQSYPVLKQQPSDKGNDVRFYKTLKQGCATHGLGTEVFGALWPTERARFSSITVFERYCQGRFMGTVGLRLNRYFIKFDKFYEIIRQLLVIKTIIKKKIEGRNFPGSKAIALVA